MAGECTYIFEEFVKIESIEGIHRVVEGRVRTMDCSGELIHRVVDQVGSADHVLLHCFHLLTQVVVTLEVPRELLPLELLEV